MRSKSGIKGIKISEIIEKRNLEDKKSSK